MRLRILIWKHQKTTTAEMLYNFSSFSVCLSHFIYIVYGFATYSLLQILTNIE